MAQFEILVFADTILGGAALLRCYQDGGEHAALATEVPPGLKPPQPTVAGCRPQGLLHPLQMTVMRAFQTEPLPGDQRTRHLVPSSAVLIPCLNLSSSAMCPELEV